MDDLGSALQISGTSLEAADSEAYVGPKHPVYWHKWSNLSVRNSTLGWNWSAFVLGPIWMGYRRMHKEAMISLALGIAFAGSAMMLADNLWGRDTVPATFTVACLLAYVAYGAKGDHLYFQATARNAGKARAALGGVAPGAWLKMQGGTATASALAWTVACFAWILPTVLFAPQIPATQQQASYFSDANFRNPVLMRSLFEQLETPSIPFELQLANAIYVKFAADRLAEMCGWQPAMIAGTVKTALDAGVGIILTASTLDTLSKTFQGQSDAAVIWIKGVSSFDTLRQFARNDLDRFVLDHQTCNSPQVVRMGDGVNWYLTSVAPKLVL